MKTCTQCKVTKEITEYNKRSSAADGHSSACRECSKQQSARSYKAKAKYYVQKNVNRVKQRYSHFSSWRSTLKCTECNENDSACLDFHHVDPTQKDDVICELVRQHSIERVAAELDKCVCLCANCHRKAHAYNKQYQIAHLGKQFLAFSSTIGGKSIGADTTL